MEHVVRRARICSDLPVSDNLPDDPETLKAMLLAERHESERLRQIIKELQRHRFGRKAETPSSMTAASNSTTIPSNDQSVASSSVARTRCLPDPTVAPNTGLSSRPW